METRSRFPLAIIQARMGSTRLPGKSLYPLIGKPVLWHVVDRLRFCRCLQSVVVATTTEIEDDAIEQWCCENWVQCYRGSALDVLDRYYQAALFYQADAIVRITADCPAIDPFVVDELVQGFMDGGYDVYGLGGEFPDGLDCEVFSFRMLELAWSQARLASEREHVTPYLYKQKEHCHIGHLAKFQGLQHHRWTLDEPADLQLLQAVFHHLYQEDTPFATQDILTLLDQHPDLYQINRGITRNEGYLRSIQNDHVMTVRT
ncbi:MAG: glycosyltransferase family protein [Nitrospirota bacterium]|nr:glycosyltransferase family protein [Nitrospirota bacterium]